MGDRSSIYITNDTDDSVIRIYGHWSGDDNAKAVVNLLTRTDRVGDPMYLTAQAFYEFAITLGGYTGSTGFGIGSATYIDFFDDNEPIVINADTGEVKFEDTHYTQEDFVKQFSELSNQEIGETNG
jgi:hypothetical protein